MDMEVLKPLFYLFGIPLAIFLLFLVSPGVYNGSGVFNGRLTEVSWEGVMFKSCEIGFQFGEGSSSKASCSSLDQALCDKLKSEIGKVITINYDSKTLTFPVKTSTNSTCK